MKRIATMILAVLMLMMVTACDGNEGKEYVGVFEATEIIVSSEATGRLVDFSIEEGDSLQNGQFVGLIDTVQLYLSKLQLMKSAKSIRSNRPEISMQISSLKSQIDKQNYEKKRIERLIASKAATQKQLDDINSSIDLLENQLAALRSTLENNTRSLEEQGSAVDVQIEQINDKLSKCHISAPISGIVLAKYMEESEFATIGKPLFKLADINHLYLRIYLTAEDITKVKLREEITVVNDVDGSEYRGRVTWISSKAEFTPKNIQSNDERNNLVYAVKIAIENNGRLKIGMYGKIIL